MVDLTIDEKRRLIFTEERLKEVNIEMKRLEDARARIDSNPENAHESDKRYRIYVEDRIPQIVDEQNILIMRRKGLLEKKGVNT